MCEVPGGGSFARCVATSGRITRSGLSPGYLHARDGEAPGVRLHRDFTRADARAAQAAPRFVRYRRSMPEQAAQIGASGRGASSVQRQYAIANSQLFDRGSNHESCGFWASGCHGRRDCLPWRRSPVPATIRSSPVEAGRRRKWIQVKAGQGLRNVDRDRRDSARSIS